jgi:hypothetical protein
VYAQACDADSCILAARGHGERAGRLRARVESGVAARRDSCRVRCRRVRTAPCGARWACHETAVRAVTSVTGGRFSSSVLARVNRLAVPYAVSNANI